MADNVTLAAELREGTGKGAARAIRREGRVPAVIYGDKQDPITISLGYTEVMKQVNTGLFMTRLVDLEVDGKKFRTIPRDVQFEPVRDFILHIDFLRLGKGATVNVEIPVVFVNEDDSPGLKRGGVLNVVRYTVELVCPASSIPEELTIDVGGLDIGDSVHISEVDLPDDVKPTIDDRDFTIASVAAPAAEVVEEDEEEGEEGEELEGVEGEGEGEGAEEEAGEASEESSE
ncbi:MAG: 50S ribosomal protein L25/general stress protein Ctc [Hyphomicrobiales bacterium]